ncbi:3'-5' exonuclease [Alteromonas sp. PRIM-21]|uniref:3'-5' exonuclease n=1 Tax=Alteromonas sp. PRIM-21 TaxID=1454978 RepID=UPI0022B988CC|nr:3'-5' exonuclease [Alteromonas sp. PRIM-21]MCZ8530805.1 3'-5' exonuclease [Alteromonas sp. PRIM-21]
MINKWIKACSQTFKSKTKLKQRVREHQVYNTLFTAVDLELTSLNPSTTQITSVGYVSGTGSCIDLSTSGYHVINTTADLEQSPVIHGLTPDILQKGEHLEVALRALIPLFQQHMLIFHNARLDLMALNKAFKLCALPKLEVIYIDTLQLALYQLNKQHQVLPGNSATLGVCRQRLDLPAFNEHNALDDALATLQLFLAQLTELGVAKEATLDCLLHTGAVGHIQLGSS